MNISPRTLKRIRQLANDVIALDSDREDGGVPSLERMALESRALLQVLAPRPGLRPTGKTLRRERRMSTEEGRR